MIEISTRLREGGKEKKKEKTSRGLTSGHTFGLSVDVRPLQTGLTDNRSVDKRGNFLKFPS